MNKLEKLYAVNNNIQLSKIIDDNFQIPHSLGASHAFSWSIFLAFSESTFAKSFDFIVNNLSLIVTGNNNNDYIDATLELLFFQFFSTWFTLQTYSNMNDHIDNYLIIVLSTFEVHRILLLLGISSRIRNKSFCSHKLFYLLFFSETLELRPSKNRRAKLSSSYENERSYSNSKQKLTISCERSVALYRGVGSLRFFFSLLIWLSNRITPSKLKCMKKWEMSYEHSSSTCEWLMKIWEREKKHEKIDRKSHSMSSMCIMSTNVNNLLHFSLEFIWNSKQHFTSELNNDDQLMKSSKASIVLVHWLENFNHDGRLIEKERRNWKISYLTKQIISRVFW